MTRKQTMRRLQQVAETASARKDDPTRHKCFISYHVADMDEVESFLDTFGSEFIPRSVGVTSEDDFVDSDDDGYIKRTIRERYLKDSTVTIVLLGQCTWSRKFVDWEVSSSLRNDSSNKRSGLLAYPLPSKGTSAKLPERLMDNWVKDEPSQSYLTFKTLPGTASGFRAHINEAFAARLDKASMANNSRPLRQRNATC